MILNPINKKKFYLTHQLNINLEKIEALEGKIKSEMVSLKDKMSKMEEELLTYSDLVNINRIIIPFSQ